MNIDLGGNTLINGYFAGIIVSPPTGSQWIVVSSNYVAIIGNRIQADTSSAPFTITLPTSASTGDKIFIQDAKLTWNTNNLSIAGNGLKKGTGTFSSVIVSSSAQIAQDATTATRKSITVRA